MTNIEIAVLVMPKHESQRSVAFMLLQQFNSDNDTCFDDEK